MADISKINLGGTVYNIKDSVARDAIVNTLKFKGITTVTLTNEGTQVPTDIYGPKATVADIRVGDLVVYGKAEYVWVEKPKTETEPAKKYWCLLDALNAYGKLASKDSASGTTSTQPNHKHTVAVHTWVGTATISRGNYTPAGDVTLTAAADGVKISGTVSAPKLTQTGGTTNLKLVTSTAKSVTGTGKAVTSVKYTAPTHTTASSAFVTGGTVSAPTGNVNIGKTTGAAVTSVSASTAKFVKQPTYELSTETLTLPIGDAATSVSAPTGSFLTGVSCADKFVTGVTHELKTANALTSATFTAGAVTVGTGVFSQGATDFTYATGEVAEDGAGATVVTDLPALSISAPTFTPTTGLKATFGGTQATISVSGTPNLKKSTAETLNTSEAGGHSHTVTVQ